MIINLRVRTFETLTSGTTYSITGFPAPNYGPENTVPVICSTPYSIMNAYITPQGVLAFTPNIDIVIEEVVLFGAIYIIA